MWGSRAAAEAEALQRRQPGSRDADEQLYPINALRNLAMRQAVTELVLVLDVDFVPSCAAAQLSAILFDARGGELGRRLRDTEAPTALVLPAFELAGAALAAATAAPPSKQPPRGGGGPGRGEAAAADEAEAAAAAHDAAAALLPRSKKAARAMWARGDLNGFKFAQHYLVGHGATDYARWWAATPMATLHDAASGGAGAGSDAAAAAAAAPYAVTYMERYEPYVVGSRAALPAYDERFRGCLNDRVQQCYAAAARGTAFEVLPDHFVVAVPHAKSASRRATLGRSAHPLSKLRADKLLERFKAELAPFHPVNRTARGLLAAKLPKGMRPLE